MLHDLSLTTDQLDFLKSHAALEALAYSDHDIMADIEPNIAPLNEAERARMKWLQELVGILDKARQSGREQA